MRNSNWFEDILRTSVLAMLSTVLPVIAAESSTASQAEKVMQEEPVKYDMVGEAFDIKSARLLYREYHALDKENKKHTVYYRDIAGRTLVEKIIDYSRANTAPNFQQQDLRTGTIITSSIQDDFVTLIRGLSGSNGGSINDLGGFSITSKDRIAYSDKLVIDTGFDYFIRDQWGILVRGEALEFDFAVPARGRTIGMQVKKIKSSDCVNAIQNLPAPNAGFGGAGGIDCFQLAVKGWLVKQFVKPIVLAYHSETHRLLSYRGLSNIKSDDGDSQNVFISYRYL